MPQYTNALTTIACLRYIQGVDYTLGTTRDAKAPRDSSLVEACVELNLGLSLALALALTP